MERARKRIDRSSTAAEIVEKVNWFFKFYILHEAKYQSLHQSDVDVLQLSAGPLHVCGADNDIKGTTNEDDEDNIALLVGDTKDLATLTADVFPSNNISNETKVKDDDKEFFDTMDTDTTESHV